MSRMWGERRYPEVAGAVAHSATSRAAAQALEPRLSDLQDFALRLFQNATFRGLTDAELDAQSGVVSTLRPRRCELLAKGVLKDSGTTRKGPSGKPMTVWILA